MSGAMIGSRLPGTSQLVEKLSEAEEATITVLESVLVGQVAKGERLPCRGNKVSVLRGRARAAHAIQLPVHLERIPRHSPDSNLRKTRPQQACSTSQETKRIQNPAPPKSATTRPSPAEELDRAPTHPRPTYRDRGRARRGPASAPRSGPPRRPQAGAGDRKSVV